MNVVAGGGASVETALGPPHVTGGRGFMWDAERPHHQMAIGQGATAIGNYSIALGRNMHAVNGQIVIGPHIRQSDPGSLPDYGAEVKGQIRQTFVDGEWEESLRALEAYHGKEAMLSVRDWLAYYFGTGG